MRESDNFENERIMFLQKLLDIVPEMGLNQSALLETESSLNFPKAYNEILFPDGLFSIVESLEGYFDRIMLQELGNFHENDKIHQGVIKALQLRIKLVPQDFAKKLARFYAVPTNYVLWTKSIWKTGDLIWQYVRDQSNDFNYYSKRSLVGVAYVTCMGYYLTDNSEDFYKTDAFVIKTIQRIMCIAKVKKRITSIKLRDIPFLRLFS